jgi:hypothetical protein
MLKAPGGAEGFEDLAGCAAMVWWVDCASREVCANKPEQAIESASASHVENRHIASSNLAKKSSMTGI